MAGHSFTVTNLTADEPGVANNVDPALVNAWGVVPYQQMFWIADNATGALSIVDGNGVPSTGAPKSGAIVLEEGITGLAVTGASSYEPGLFQMATAGGHKSADLIAVSESGKMYGVNPDVSLTGGVMLADRSDAGAIYKGVTVVQRGQDKRGPLILAADFHNARVDVYDANFKLVNDVKFEAHGLKKGFAPFNVAALGDMIYVAYAKQDADRSDEVAGPGLGFVAVFRPDGKQQRLAKGSALNAPWGLQLVRSFGSLRRALLVGNFGDGRITVIDPDTMKIRGQLTGAKGKPIAIDGLWGLSLGDRVRNAQPGALYFAAGPEDETHGLFGRIVPSHQGGDGDCGKDP